MKSRPLLILADAVLDAGRIDASPGALLVRSVADDPRWPFAWRILASGRPEDVVAHPEGAGAERLERPDALLVPPFLNAHTHLDLTLLGPRDWDPALGFAPWADMIRRERTTDEETIRAAVEEGARRSLAGGVVGVGDIAGAGLTTPIAALAESPLAGVSYLEVFGLGERQEAAFERARETLDSLPTGQGGVRIGVQPHATYSVGVRLYEALAHEARERGRPIATHVGESVEERRFVADAEGPLRDFLERLGLFDEAAAREIGKGRSPIEHLRSPLTRTPFLCAHANDASDEDIDLLATSGTGVVFCPRSARCFDHAARLGAHRWRDMRRAGVAVCVGTDSVVNLLADERIGLPSGLERITPLDDLRLLGASDPLEAKEALELVTTAPARAMGLDADAFTLERGLVAGLVEIVGGRATGGARLLDPLAGVRLLSGENSFGQGGR